MLEEATSDTAVTMDRLLSARDRATAAGEDVDVMFPKTLEELVSDLRRAARASVGEPPDDT
jgi:hypothetical protein